jgi:hypothetical protein
VVRDLMRAVAAPHVSLGRGADSHSRDAQLLRDAVSELFCETFAGGRGTLLYGHNATHVLLALGRALLQDGSFKSVAHGHPDHKASYALSALPGWQQRLRIPYSEAGFYERHGLATLPDGCVVLLSALHPVYGTVQLDGLSSLPTHAALVSDVSQALKVMSARQLSAFFERSMAAVFNLGKVFSACSLGVLWVREPALAERVLSANPELDASLAGLSMHAVDSSLRFVRAHVNQVWFEYLAMLTRYALVALQALPHVTVFGCTSWLASSARVSIVSFTVEGLDSREVGTYLDGMGLAVRADGDCLGDTHEPRTQQLVRVSLLPHITTQDIDTLVNALAGCA